MKLTNVDQIQGTAMLVSKHGRALVRIFEGADWSTVWVRIGHCWQAFVYQDKQWVAGEKVAA